MFRNDERGNPVATLMGRFFGVHDVNIQAEATAEASPANAMTCVKPFTIPDKWIEKQTPPWDPDDTFEMYDNHGNPLDNPDVYIPADQPGYTGYNAERDRGIELMIRAGTGNDINPSFYFSYAIGGDHRRQRVRLEHRQLQHDDDGLWRPPAHGARQHGGPDHRRHRRADRQGSRRRLGHDATTKPSARSTPARVLSPFRCTTRSTTTRAS